jgi:hypothetical protein
VRRTLLFFQQTINFAKTIPIRHGTLLDKPNLPLSSKYRR